MFFRPLKTAVAIFSFTLILLFSIGSYFLYTAYLKNYKTEFKQYISAHRENTHLTSITINPSELYCNSARVTWEDENKEIVHKGILYDIVTIRFKGRTVELTVVSDEQEMELKKQFASLYNIDSHATTKGPFSLLKTFFSLKFIVNANALEFKAVKINTAAYFPPQSFNLSHKAIPKDSPPPDLSVQIHF